MNLTDLLSKLSATQHQDSDLLYFNKKNKEIRIGKKGLIAEWKLNWDGFKRFRGNPQEVAKRVNELCESVLNECDKTGYIENSKQDTEKKQLAQVLTQFNERLTKSVAGAKNLFDTSVTRLQEAAPAFRLPSDSPFLAILCKQQGNPTTAEVERYFYCKHGKDLQAAGVSLDEMQTFIQPIEAPSKEQIDKWAQSQILTNKLYEQLGKHLWKDNFSKEFIDAFIKADKENPLFQPQTDQDVEIRLNRLVEKAREQRVEGNRTHWLTYRVKMIEEHKLSSLPENWDLQEEVKGRLFLREQKEFEERALEIATKENTRLEKEHVENGLKLVRIQQVARGENYARAWKYQNLAEEIGYNLLKDGETLDQFARDINITWEDFLRFILQQLPQKPSTGAFQFVIDQCKEQSFEKPGEFEQALRKCNIHIKPLEENTAAEISEVEMATPRKSRGRKIGAALGKAGRKLLHRLPKR